MNPLPKPGDQIQFKGGELWAFHSNCVENAKRLVPGELYTVDTIEMASSWTKVTLKEFPEKEFGDDCFALHFFQWSKCDAIRNNSKCENPAEWSYMPAMEGESSEFCWDCLAELSNYKPCSCEVNTVPGLEVQYSENGDSYDLGVTPPPDYEENISWKWLDKGKTWYKIDKGRPYPCCEYWPTDYKIRKYELSKINL